MRENSLQKIFDKLDEDSKVVLEPLMSDIYFIETQLSELKKLPFIEISTKNPARQRETAAARQYKGLLQQYNMCIKTLLSALNHSDGEDESPLREYLNNLKNRS